MLQREETVTGLVHPETIGGHTVWSAQGTSPGDLADKLRYGDPARGWEGDERLALVLNTELDQWELWRLDMGQYHLVARRPTDQPLDERLIDYLVAKDTRRTDPLKALYAHNARIDKAKFDRNVEQLVEAGERLRFEVKKAGLA